MKKRMGFVVKEDKTLKQMALYMVLIMSVMICFVVALEHLVEQKPDPEEIEKEAALPTAFRQFWEDNIHV